jgi:hypothetical protein
MCFWRGIFRKPVSLFQIMLRLIAVTAPEPARRRRRRCRSAECRRARDAPSAVAARLPVRFSGPVIAIYAAAKGQNLLTLLRSLDKSLHAGPT